MSNLSQFIGTFAGARVGDVVELSSDAEVVVEGGKTFLRAGVEVPLSDYPGYNKKLGFNPFNFKVQGAPRSYEDVITTSPTLSSSFGHIETDGNGVWIMVQLPQLTSGTISSFKTPTAVWRSEDNGVTWKCVFVFNNYFLSSLGISGAGANASKIGYINNISTNYIGTWTIRYYVTSSTQPSFGFIYSEDNGLTWQIAPGSISQPTVFGSMVIQPYARALVLSPVDNQTTSQYHIWYSPDFGRNWFVTTDYNGSASPNAGVHGTPMNTLPVFAPDGSYWVAYSNGSAWYWLKYQDTIYLSSGASGDSFGPITMATAQGMTTIAFDNQGYMYIGGYNVAYRNKTRYRYDMGTGKTDDLRTAIGFGSTQFFNFLANPNNPTVYVANTGTGGAVGFKVSTDGGTTWSAERRRQCPEPTGGGAAMGRDGKIIGASGYLTNSTTVTLPLTRRRFSDVYVIANAAVSTNASSLFPTVSRVNTINSSSFLVYSYRDKTAYSCSAANGGLTPLSSVPIANVYAYVIASNDTGANVVICDGTNTIKYSNNGLFTDGTMNVNYVSSPACNVFVDSRAITQNVQESGFSFSTRETTIYYLGFSSDGTKMYTAGTQKGNLDQYALSTAWNPATATYDNKFLNLKTKEPTPYAGFFKPDGSQFYTIGAGSNVHQYTLSTAWDVSTATYNTHCNVVTTISQFTTGLAFTPNGKFMYINSTGDNRVTRLRLNEEWNVATANVESRSVRLTNNIDDGSGPYFSPDGKKMYYNITGYIVEQTLLRPWDITSFNPFMNAQLYYNYRLNPIFHDSSPGVLAFKPDGKRVYTAHHTNDNVYSYQMNTSPNFPVLSPAIGIVYPLDFLVDITYSNGAFLGISRDGIIVKSVDNGQTWERKWVTDILHYVAYGNKYTGSNNEYPKRIRLSSNGTAIAVTSHEIYRSTDYGNTFTQIPDYYEYNEPVNITTDNNGNWAFSNYYGEVKFSYDDGRTWGSNKESLSGLSPVWKQAFSLYSTTTADLYTPNEANNAVLCVESIGSNCWAILIGDRTDTRSNSYLYVTKDNGVTWETTWADSMVNTNSVLMSCGNDLFIMSNTANFGGVQTLKTTIGLTSYTKPNEYLRVE